MPKDKNSGKKLADMMYGEPTEAERRQASKPAFGVYPMVGKRREDRQDREAAKNFPVDLGRGAIAGFLGMAGDIESVGRLPYELYTGNESPTFLPTSEDILKRIPFGSETPAGQFASGIGTIAGGSANIGPIIRGVRAAPGALKAAARNLSAPRTMGPEAGAVRIKAPSAPQEKAMRLAQQRAALPVEQGGLGLPPDNTPEMRAMAMGFDTDTYHGSFRDITKFDPSVGSTESHAGRGIYSTDSPEDASLNYASIYGPDVSGRVERAMEELDKDWRKTHRRMRDEVLTPRQQEIILQNTINADNLGVVYPLKVRSNKSIHLDAPEANPVRIGPFESYDEAADAYVDTPHTAKFNEALDEFRELGGEANPVYEVVQDYGGPVPARDVFNVVKKTGDEYGLYDPFTGEIVSGGVAAGDFVRHFGIDEIRHTPEFRNQQLNIGNEHTISLNPDNVRSRFAAFDPFRKDVATAAAMGVLAPDLLAKEKDEDKKKDKETKKASGGRIHISDNPDVMQLELAGGGLVRKGIKAIKSAAESAGQKAPVLAEKELTTLQDVHTNLGDRVRAGAMEAQKMMEGFDYKYDKGQRVFTKDSSGKNKPPYTILSRTRVGNQVMREDHPEFGQGMGRPIIDPETGKAMRTPYEPGYRVRMERSPDDWSEFEIPEKAIVGDVEMAAGGLVKGLKAAAKAVKGTQDVLPAAEREANKAKFLEPSAVKERMYHGTTANINQFKPQTGDAVFLTPDPRFASKFAWNDMLFTASPQDGGFINPGANVMPVHVQAKNPFDYENSKHIRSVLSNLDPRDKKAFKKAASEGSWQEIEKHIGTIQDTGFDSVFLKEMGRKNLAVFEPSQIKSAIGNRGTYDIEDPDITKAEGGAVRMQAGGLAKAAKAAAKALKPAEAPMKASEALGRVEGRPLVITQADRTKVGGGYLGGPGFSGLQLTEPEYRAAEAAWGVKTPGVAKMILGGGKAAGKDPVYAAMLGTPTQHQSNQMVFDKLYGDFKKSAKKGSLDPELRDRINMRLANTVDKEGNPIFPSDVDILGKNFKELANTFDRRAVTANLIGGMGVGGKKGQIIDYDKIIRETTDPLLIDAPTGALGNRLFTLSGGIIERPDLHPAFPTILQGEDLGVSFDPVARELIMKDFMERTMREKGRTPGYMDYTRGYPPSQLITEDLLTELQKMGKKAGGEVKAPAAQIDGNKFVLAAQKYGLGDDMATLNKMVSLVNQGATVEEAARVLAGGVRKAAGGEITADDLILEERKL